MPDVFREDSHTQEGIKHLHYLRTMREGIVGMFTILASMAGVWENPRGILITIGGITLGGAIRTAIGIYATTRGENKYLKHEIEQERLEILLVPELERKELRMIYQSKGFEGELLEQIVKKITSDEEQWIREMVQEELGYSDALESISSKVTGILFFLFIIGSGFPLAPYLFLYKSGYDANTLFSYSIVSTIIGLIIVGLFWKNITGEHWFRSAIRSISIGLIAFGASIIVGSFFDI